MGVSDAHPPDPVPGPSAGPVAPAAAGDRELAEELLAVIGSLRRRVRRAAQAEWPLAGLTGAQAELLRLLRRRPGVSVAAAAAELDLAPNSVSTLVGRLASAGLVQRVPAEHDRRVARLHLTPQAAATLERWRDRRLHALAAAVTALSEADRAQLRAALPLLGRLGELTTPAAGGPRTGSGGVPALGITGGSARAPGQGGPPAADGQEGGGR